MWGPHYFLVKSDSYAYDESALFEASSSFLEHTQVEQDRNSSPI